MPIRGEDVRIEAKRRARAFGTIDGMLGGNFAVYQTFLDGRHIPTRAVMPNVAASASDDPRRLIQRRNVMTAINAKSEAINAKSEALELHELSSEELDAVSGGLENKKQAEALKGFQQALQSL